MAWVEAHSELYSLEEEEEIRVLASLISNINCKTGNLRLIVPVTNKSSDTLSSLIINVVPHSQ